MDAVLHVDRTEARGAISPTTSRRGKPSTDTSPPGRRTACSTSSTDCCADLSDRTQAGDAEPNACALDAQSIKTSANVPATGQGIDAGKKIAGRKRHIGVDTLGLLLAVWVPLVRPLTVPDSSAAVGQEATFAVGRSARTAAGSRRGAPRRVAHRDSRSHGPSSAGSGRGPRPRREPHRVRPLLPTAAHICCSPPPGRRIGRRGQQRSWWVHTVPCVSRRAHLHPGPAPGRIFLRPGPIRSRGGSG